MKETAMSDTENSIHDFDFSLICELKKHFQLAVRSKSRENT